MKTDYLVIGCGASAMAFVDVMLAESDATFTLVDRRDAPGGHWNDAYPFVRLHQPSAYYGVASRPLGRDRIDAAGPNAGFRELASGPEVLAYFHSVMDETFLPSGRVDWRPMTEWRDEDGMLVDLMSGEETQIEIGRALVDGRRIGTEIPLTYDRPFEVAEGVTCIPPNDLPRRAAGFSAFVVIGAGKTAMDAALWLLSRGVDPDAIAWARPRDAWMINRRSTQPGIDFFHEMIGGAARQAEILAEARSLEEAELALEAAGLWLRIDPDRRPEMMHSAVCSEGEIEALRRIRHVIRLGHLRRAEPGRLRFDAGEATVPPGALLIDCAASAAKPPEDGRAQVFSPGRIDLEMIRPFQPTFSAALIGHLEATIPDLEAKQALTRVTPMNDTSADWASSRFIGNLNEAAWSKVEGLSQWIRNCRLNGPGHALRRLDPEDAAQMAVLGRIQAATPKAMENLPRLLA
ncbi:MAG: NAD(P)/FAD-dependent oxidoreductase [Pseudomonadota bacterium]